jgi:ribosomal-protein-alanine N-acetyltransferase
MPGNSVTIRSATPTDIQFLMALERASPTAAHWSEERYRQAVQPCTGDPERLVLAAEGVTPAAAGGSEEAEAGSGLLGFLVARYLAPEWELENIVVAAAARRRGLGKQLLEALFARAKETHSEALFLEVRESNTGARSLYEAAGFQQAGRRKSYYTDPVEDAILYRQSMS